ncbi:MAG: LLM class flavin-dependent oxidoreductase, partial [Mycobacteriaceae bacterium]|nr:LLM class flavin-dependent oxidoreductase [Mycobacteriaceae bacterium]
AAKLGMAWGSSAQRRAQVAETVEAVRAAVDPAPEIVVAAGGPRMLAAAARIADRILLAAMPQATEADVAEMVRIARDNTDRDLRFTHQVTGIGDALPFWLAERLGLDAEALRAAGAAGLLPADPAAIADTLRRRRAEYGIDEIIVPGELAPAFAPVFAGR